VRLFGRRRGGIDAAWHAFILHTRDYESYCRERFGRVIHHEPTGEADPHAYRGAYDRRARQGEPDPAIWAVPAVGAPRPQAPPAAMARVGATTGAAAMAGAASGTAAPSGAAMAGEARAAAEAAADPPCRSFAPGDTVEAR
jgi:hypothetical protein